MFSQLRTNKGNLRSWKARIDRSGTASSMVGRGRKPGITQCSTASDGRRTGRTGDAWRILIVGGRSMDREGKVEWVENLMETFCAKVRPG